jgi:hypothetical protein
MCERLDKIKAGFQGRKKKKTLESSSIVIEMEYMPCLRAKKQL